MNFVAIFLFLLSFSVSRFHFPRLTFDLLHILVSFSEKLTSNLPLATGVFFSVFKSSNLHDCCSVMDFDQTQTISDYEEEEEEKVEEDKATTKKKEVSLKKKATECTVVL